MSNNIGLGSSNINNNSNANNNSRVNLNTNRVNLSYISQKIGLRPLAILYCEIWNDANHLTKDCINKFCKKGISIEHETKDCGELMKWTIVLKSWCTQIILLRLNQGNYIHAPSVKVAIDMDTKI
jgi:hypothetical protein